MCKESDNTAFNIAKRLVGQEKVEDMIDSLGMSDTEIFANNQKTTPADVGKIFEKLYKNEILSQKNSSEILEFLRKTIYENWLSKGLPEGIEISHKYGREVHVINDAGIVFSTHPYVLVILSKGIDDNEGDRVFPELARSIYEIQISPEN